MALPTLTPEQRAAALKKAAEVRTKRAAVRQQIKDGKLSIKDVIGKAGDPIVGKIRVKSLLPLFKGVGKVNAQKILGEIGISDTRRVQGLGAKQAKELIERLG